MSTLTKILIVLLTLSSIFLCGITVTYVGTANNYKELYDNQSKDIQSITKKRNDLEKKVNSLKDDLSNAQATYDSDRDDFELELRNRDAAKKLLDADLEDASQRFENAQGALADYAKTVALNDELRKTAELKVTELLAEQTANTKKIKDLTDEVVNLNALISDLQTTNKQLVEEKTKLQNDVDKYLQVAGLKSISPGAVTASSGVAQLTAAVKNIDLEGVIMEVKPQDSLVSISIGSAHGVKGNMRFHVIRNNEFICDVVVSKVDADQSSGYLDLVTNKMPKAGDIIKTNF